MKRSVKTNLSHAPTIFFNVGVRSQSARAAWLVRVPLAITGITILHPINYAFGIGIRTVSQFE